MNKDYYKILGIEKGASEHDVKQAYRRLAHQYHPDRPSGDEKKFKEINEAYQILSNKDKRAQYDRFGRAFDYSTGGDSPFGEWFSAGGGPASGWGFGFDPESVNFDDLGNISDIFDVFFEGLGVRKKRRAYERGADLEMEQQISLEEAFRGAEKIINFKTFDSCSECSGLGHFIKEGFTQCSACDGRGEIKENRKSFFGSFAQVKTCVRCFGAGQIPNKTCKKCNASGRIENQKNIKVEMVAGLADGQIIKIPKTGEAGERGAEKGDLYIRVRVKPHPVFTREGDNLLVKKELDLVDVLLGKKITIKTIAGGSLNIEIPEGFNLTERLKVSGEGMTRLGGYGRGDLYVRFEIRTPKKLNPKIKKLLDDSKEE